MARRWQNCEYDRTDFRGPAGVVSVEQVWDPELQKWLPYAGENAFKRGMFGAPATKQEAESQRFENGLLVVGRTRRKRKSD